jgi:hypothetical protein
MGVVFLVRDSAGNGWDQTGAKAIQAQLKVGRRPNGARSLAFHFFEFAQLPLIKQAHFLTNSPASLSASLTIWTYGPMTAFIFH